MKKTDKIVAALAANPYGMTAATLAYELATPKAEIEKRLKALVAIKEIVTYKVARNAAMYSLPRTCAWSTAAAVLAGL